MLIDFFFTLRAAKLKVSVKEYLMLLEALQAGVLDGGDGPSVDKFYYLARTALVKDETAYDKFDRAFAAYFKGVEMLADFSQEIPLDWLQKKLELELSAEEKAQIEKMGWDELMETLKKRFEEQKKRHEGGNKMIGTGGTSPFGAYGYNPQGIRIGQDKGRNRSAVKVWDQRQFKDYDDSLEIGTRNIKVALRRLRRFAREGSADELDLDDTIRSTAANAGYLDIKMIPGAAQPGQGAAADGCGRHDGRARAPRGRDLQCRQVRVQAPRVLLLPQLRVRPPVAQQPAPLQREVPHLGRDPQVQQGLQADLRGRCHHEPVRDPAAGRQRRIQQRGSRCRVAAAPDARLPEIRVDQSGTAGRVAIPAEHRARAAADEPAHVPAHPARSRRRHAHTQQMRGVTRLIVATGAVLMLGGCSSLKLPWSKKDENKPAAQAPVKLRDMYLLEVKAPRGQRELLTEFLDLARFQRAPEDEAITGPELDRLIAGAPAQARSLVETQGYFNAQATARRDGTGKDGLPKVLVEVDPGPRTTIADVELDAQGPLKQAAQAQDRAAQRQLAELRDRWPLKTGQPFTQSAWDGAKGTALNVLRADGYPAADWASTSARIEAERNRAQLYALADSGPLFRFGEIRIEGLERYQESDVRNLTTFRSGDRYTEKALLDTQERLQRSGLFEGAVVSIEPDPALAGAVPVTARVREAPLQQATVGLGYADQTGERITLEHTHRRVFNRLFFGTQWTAKNKIELGRVNQSWQSDLSSHPLRGGWRNLIGAGLSNEETAGTQVKAARLRVGRAVETERIDRQVFAEVQQATTTTAGVQEKSRALTGNYHWIWRNLDNNLLPTRGWAANIESAVGYAWADPVANGSFARLRAGDRLQAARRRLVQQRAARAGAGVCRRQRRVCPIPCCSEPVAMIRCAVMPTAALGRCAMARSRAGGCC